jgi:hypothetical protein
MMNPVIERMLQEDVNVTPYYRVVYRLVESDVYIKKVCDFICDVYEGKIQKPGLSAFSYNLEFLFEPFNILVHNSKGKYILSLKGLMNFLWKLSDCKVCFVRGDTVSVQNKYMAVNLKNFSPSSMRMNYYFVSAIKEDGTLNVQGIDAPEKVLTPKIVSELLDKIKKYALIPYKFKAPSESEN